MASNIPTQHNNIQLNDMQYTDTQHYNIQQNDMQHDNTAHILSAY
jgi:hypothetical protein